MCIYICIYIYDTCVYIHIWVGPGGVSVHKWHSTTHPAWLFIVCHLSAPVAPCAHALASLSSHPLQQLLELSEAFPELTALLWRSLLWDAWHGFPVCRTFSSAFSEVSSLLAASLQMALVWRLHSVFFGHASQRGFHLPAAPKNANFVVGFPIKARWNLWWHRMLTACGCKLLCFEDA